MSVVGDIIKGLIPLLAMVWFTDSLLAWIEYYSDASSIYISSFYERMGIYFGPIIIIIEIFFIMATIEKDIKKLKEKII